ncbi:DUF1810 domain-containing protein [Arthrobacter glacialis]|uniref:DUF1810 domain-containing protein n=1 Tax=Arthrobacter glacialis TaxID=1664 RepID=A0A2S3ZW21_ARTGL|nr:DUF1810 domain-containing protein [Arthrobacter glacialis]POH73087.1 DUF1810 domain-containing protein [Arthrobacter glacialis]
MDYDLDRFVAAQSRVYDDVKAELAAGRKTSHWMWFVFPQVAGLGSSDYAKLYAISSLAEAVSYAAHPVLGTRLRECAQLVLNVPGLSAVEILGGMDAKKLQSSMALFAAAAPEEPVFGEVLERFYGGMPDPATEAILAQWRRV